MQKMRANRTIALSGWRLAGLLDKVQFHEGTNRNNHNCLIYIGKEGSLTQIIKQHASEIIPWQQGTATKTASDIIALSGKTGPLWIVNHGKQKPKKVAEENEEFACRGLYAKARDSVGRIVARLEDAGIAELTICFAQAKDDEILGFLVGLQLISYRFRITAKERSTGLHRIYLAGSCAKLCQEARLIGNAMNLTRHLVNLPANMLHPKSYGEMINQIFKGESDLSVTVLDKARLQKEKMRLILAVAQGSQHPPIMVHLRYRPRTKAKKVNPKPVALVGKGITFDSGGLDMKTSATMRLMKKDMAGSATLLGLAYYWLHSGRTTPFDIYLPIAENGISGSAIHPGDVIASRQGLTVEISNTDAEGRLLLADAINYALTRPLKDRPAFLIDVATLTGASKVALGPDIIALFSNHDELAAKLEKAAHKWGDPLWRLPLHGAYSKALKSPIADLQNASSSPYAGAITAALFLQKFATGLPWAHLDLMAWADALGQPGLISSGPNAQGLQCLIGMLQEIP